MSVEENKRIAHRIYEIINSGNVAEVDQVIARDIVDHEEMPGLEGSGVERFKQFLSIFRAAFPDLRMSAEDVIAEGDRAAVRYTMTGTHRGEFMGMAPTGKQITVAGIEIIRVAGGKAVEHWGVTDQMAMLQQLGAIPA